MRAAAGLVAMVVALVLMGPSAAGPGPAVVATPGRAVAGGEGLRVESTTTYSLDLAATVVRVRYEVTLTNQAPDVVRGGFINQRFFPEYGLGVVAEATNITATKSDGTSLSVRTESTESPLFKLAIADLSPNLFYPNTQTITIAYDVPALPARAEGLTRINEAFATFPVYGVGDPGLTTVEVRLPADLDVELIGSEMERREVDGAVVYRAEAIAVPDDFFVDVVARDDDKLVRRVVDVGEHDVVVLGWPNDPEWADFVADTVGDGVPGLEELIGLDWPAERDIDVVETVAPYLYGYAGWYQPSFSLIEVGDQLDAQVILHELSHVWFNDELFRGRWINEALAEVFSVQALADLGEEVPEPAAVDPAGPGALRLNAWGDVDLQSADTDAQETYGYNTSWVALDRIADEVGLEALAETVREADEARLPYRAETADSVMLRAPDWRTLLDLLEEVSGSGIAESVFRELVVTPAEAVTLDERAAARLEYAALVEAGDGWSPPAEVRSLMTDWRFAAATELFPEVQELLAVRDDMAEVLEEIGEPVPEPLQVTFEGERYLEDVVEVVGAAHTASEDLSGAHEARDDASGPLVAVGLLLSDVDGDLDAAAASLRSGDYDEASRQATSAHDELDGAATAGAVRLGGVAVVALALVLLLVVLRRRRRSGPGPAEVAAAEAAAGEPSAVIAATADDEPRDEDQGAGAPFDSQ